MSVSDPYLSRLDTAVEAALEAGRHIRFQAGRVERSRVADKGVHDLVTEVDEACQAMILARIQRAFPEDELLGEEGEDFSSRAPLAAEAFRWIVDPIDGTTNFMHGVPPYAVSIGVQQGDRMVVGVVYDVSRDELFSAARGHGLRMNGRPAGVTATNVLNDALLTTGFPYRSFDHVDAYLQVFAAFMRESRGVRRPGSASVDLAYVACGRFDGFFETGLQPWDVAAGCLLVEEGGGTVSDYSGTDSPIYSAQVVASNGPLHARMLQVLAPMADVRA